LGVGLQKEDYKTPKKAFNFAAMACLRAGMLDRAIK
jgi:hypothetical protein